MQRNQFGEPQNRIFELLDRLSPFVLLNFTWVVLSLPVITLIPATAGLYHATHLMVRHGDASMMDVWRGFRRYFWKSWLWAGLNILVFGILISNYLFYNGFSGRWTTWVRLTILLMAFFWLCLQLYTFPMLLFQEDKRLRTAVRNSYIAFILRPFFTIGWTIILLIPAVLASLFAFPAWIIFLATLCLYVSNWATRRTLDAIDPNLVRGYKTEAPSAEVEDG